jgi:hypothetical protein
MGFTLRRAAFGQRPVFPTVKWFPLRESNCRIRVSTHTRSYL